MECLSGHDVTDIVVLLTLLIITLFTGAMTYGIICEAKLNRDKFKYQKLKDLGEID